MTLNLNNYEIRELKGDDYNKDYLTLLSQYYQLNSSKMTQEFLNNTF